jgi:hypothetical protein
VILVVEEEVVQLTAPERRFCEEYFSGQFASNGTRSYLAVNPGFSYDNASVAASDLLKQPRVQRFLRQLRQQAMEGLAETLKPWMPLAVKAQRRLENHLDGIERLTGTDLAVIREILDRACGKAKETLELDPGDQMSKLIMELAAQRPSRYVRPGPSDRALPAGVALDNGGSSERSE